MPEGDTIHRSAWALDRALAGRALVRFEAQRLTFEPFPPGTTVLGAEAKGKHCLLRFSDGRTLHTHMRMTGSWHLYRPGERWRRAAGGARVTIEVASDADGKQGWVAVCFTAPIVELVRSEEDDGTGHLGPDLCRPDADLDEAVRRFGALSDPNRAVGDALLDQRIACGVGNVYRCEVCFAYGLDPATPIRLLDDDLRRRLLDSASRMMRANLGTVDRITIDGGGLAVHGRGGAPCKRCGTAILTRAQGDAARIAYWCPSCQTIPPSPAPAPATATTPPAGTVPG